ncbi:MAG: NUDIX domain-containing protein [Actinomycetota bacterium]|nr:NUDIX domain-containing protein [Actinomycetota bacterium]
MAAQTTFPQVAVGAIVIDSDELLMIRRAADPGRGLWTIPGGRVENGELLAEALKREVLEETGLEVDPGDLVGILEVPGDPHYVILDFYARLTGGREPHAQQEEVAEARWVPLDDVPDLECTPRFLETMRGWGVLAEP